MENWTHDFNIGSMVRTANAFQARRVHIVGPHKWNRKGALMTELYQHVENHPSITELVECWKLRVAGEIAAAQSQAAAIAFHMRGSAAATDGTSGTAPNTSETMAQLEALDAKIAELQAARVIALDIIPGAVPMETYHFPKRCLMLFGAEGPGLSEKALELADDVVYISQFGSALSHARRRRGLHARLDRPARRAASLIAPSARGKKSRRTLLYRKDDQVSNDWVAKWKATSAAGLRTGHEIGHTLVTQTRYC